MSNLNLTQHSMDRFSQRGGIELWRNSGSDLGVMSYLKEEALKLYEFNLNIFKSVDVVVDSFKAKFGDMTFVYSKSETGHPALVTVY